MQVAGTVAFVGVTAAEAAHPVSAKAVASKERKCSWVMVAEASQSRCVVTQFEKMTISTHVDSHELPLGHAALFSPVVHFSYCRWVDTTRGYTYWTCGTIFNTICQPAGTGNSHSFLEYFVEILCFLESSPC